MVEVRYLKPDEKRLTISLWKEAFPEDSQSFLEYYYTEKTRDNAILAAEEDGRIVSMVQRNPYELYVHGQTVSSDYIVAVATARDKRHRGLMRMLLNRMLEDMYREGMAFCYLMPADRRIYEPFDFAYIYDQPHWRLGEAAERAMDSVRVTESEAGEAAAWMNDWLARRYRVFAKRDEAYVRRLLRELESEKGWMEVLCEKQNLQDSSGAEGCGNGKRSDRWTGIRCIWGTEKQEQRMLLCGEAYVEEEKSASPAIMARVTHLTELLKMVHLKESSPFSEMKLRLTVEDRLCSWNQGQYFWKLKKDGSEVVRLPESEADLQKTGQDMKALGAATHLNMNIAQLTQWIFGYCALPEACVERGSERSGWSSQIALLAGVFLDEVV